MSVKIAVLNETAEVKNGVWSCNDGYLLGLVSETDIDSIIGYTPWPDYTLAEMACKALGGKIVGATDPPEYVEGRVY